MPTIQQMVLDLMDDNTKKPEVTTNDPYKFIYKLTWNNNFRTIVRSKEGKHIFIRGNSVKQAKMRFVKSHLNYKYSKNMLKQMTPMQVKEGELPENAIQI